MDLRGEDYECGTDRVSWVSSTEHRAYSGDGVQSIQRMGRSTWEPSGTSSSPAVQDALWIQMMGDFEFDIRTGAEASWDVPQDISLRSGQVCFTELLRSGSNGSDEYLKAPPIQLAFWITDNWWRLRWEPVVSERVDPNWRLAHELSAIGGGYVWPRLRIWGEDARVGLACRSDPLSMNFALRYTKDALVFVGADQFEMSVDQFLDRAVDAYSDDKAALGAQLTALREERKDNSIATWRRFEAKLGYDVDAAPSDLIEVLLSYVNAYGHDGVEEAIVASQGEAAAATLKEEIEIAKRSKVVCELHDAISAAGRVRRGSGKPIWEIAEEAATAVRHGLRAEGGPLKNTRLGDLLNVSKDHFRSRESEPAGRHYGLRLREGDGEKNVVALSARWPQGRRFEMCRTLGDAIWSGNDALGPITKAKTGRQKFQRAFAQSLLCPYEDLLSYINTETPSEDDISAAARFFHVSERVIQTVLVNKGVIGRRQFDEMVEAA